MKKALKIDLVITLILVLLGQLLFLLWSPRFLTVNYSNQIFVTTGVKHKQEDLHKLNEAAHYFGETMIGWMKFPNFMADLNESVPLPEGSAMHGQLQERQNMIFVLNTPSPIELEDLRKVKAFIQSKIDDYNEVSQTEFVLTNVDYNQLEEKKTYAFGAVVVLAFTLILALAWGFIRREFKFY